MSRMKIIIENLNNRIIQGEDKTRTLLKHLQDNQIDWLHACGAKGRCTTCKAIIVAGSEALSPPTRFEEKYFQIGELYTGERLSCQVLVEGDIVIRVPEEGKLPHIVYSV
jgi:2Fe-2S ferredoxin